MRRLEMAEGFAAVRALRKSGPSALRHTALKLTPHAICKSVARRRVSDEVRLQALLEIASIRVRALQDKRQLDAQDAALGQPSVARKFRRAYEAECDSDGGIYLSTPLSLAQRV